MADKDKKDKDDGEAPQQILDPRLEWFCEPVTKLLKVKSDKWKRTVSAQENWFANLLRFLCFLIVIWAWKIESISPRVSEF
jgi:hypothetical protein